MNEKEKLIKDSLEKIEIPESLLPENIEKKLDEADKRNASQKKPVRKWKGAAMAASCALVLLVGISIPQVMKNGEKGAAESASETAVEPTDGASVPTAYDLKGVMHSAKSYDEITEIMDQARKEYKKQQQENAVRDFFMPDVVYETDVMEEAATEDSSSNTKTAGADYSNTNVRTEGVDEGDIVKTDGHFIYQRYPMDAVRIIRLNNGEMNVVATVSVGDEGSGFVQEIYLDGNKMMVVYECTETELKTKKQGFTDYSYTDTTRTVRVATYDISDKAAPKKQGEISVEGTYYSSRYTGGHVYVMTTFGQSMYYYCYDDAYKDMEVEDFIPRINDKYVEAQDIMIPAEAKDEPFFVVSACDVKHPSKVTDTKAVMGYVDQVYVSTDNIYFYSGEYTQSGYEETTIVKFNYAEGKIIPQIATTVRGTIDDSFCIDEDVNGYLRVAATARDENWVMESSVYIFDKNLKQTGSLLDIAGNEGIKSCRFVGDIGYVVTFRNTDPLFTLDLSNPNDPKILSELKLPGFSEYLHRWNDGLLLGIGYDADEESGAVGNVKLSMFDVSDPANTLEVTTKVLDVTGADVLYGDYKSLLIDPKKNLLGFYCDSGYWDDNYTWHSKECYKLFEYSYTEQEFLEVLSVEVQDGYDSSIRGIYSGDYFYLVNNEEITSYKLYTYEEVAKLK